MARARDGRPGHDVAADGGVLSHHAHGKRHGAAALLNAAQPGISTALRQSETHLGLRLLERIGGRLHPTPEATELLPDTEAVISRIAFLDQRTEDLRTGRGGALTIAAVFPIDLTGILDRAE